MHHYNLPSEGIAAYGSEESESQIPGGMRDIPENTEALFAPLVFPYYEYGERSVYLPWCDFQWIETIRHTTHCKVKKIS